MINVQVGLYGKAIAGAAVNTLLVILAALTDHGISLAEWVGIGGTAVLSGVGIVALRNTRGVLTYTKAITAGVTAALGILGTSLADGSLSVAELTTLVLGVAGSLGITGAVSNAVTSDTITPRHAAGVGSGGRTL